MPESTIEPADMLRELASVRAELAERGAAQEAFVDALEMVGSRFGEILAQHRALQIVCATLYVELSLRSADPDKELRDMLERVHAGILAASEGSGLDPRIASAAARAVKEVAETARHMGEKRLS